MSSSGALGFGFAMGWGDAQSSNSAPPDVVINAQAGLSFTKRAGSRPHPKLRLSLQGGRNAALAMQERLVVTISERKHSLDSTFDLVRVRDREAHTAKGA